MAGTHQGPEAGPPSAPVRANGAGASLTGLKEDQGPGQPDAPGTHRKSPAAPRGAAARAHHPGAKSKDEKSHGKKSRNKQDHGNQHQGMHPPGQQGPKPGKSG